jgi:hypothetical protein
MSEQGKRNSGVDRRGFVVGMMLGAIGGALPGGSAQSQAAAPAGCPGEAARAAGAPTGPLVPWMYLHTPLEHWFPDCKRTFDAWEEGGVRGIVVGRLHFYEQVPDFEITYRVPGKTFPTFKADPSVYKSFGVAPPADAPRDLKKEKQLQELLDNAAARGWEILFFGAGQAAGSRPGAEDPFGVVGFAATVEDTLAAYPQAHGIIIDGAGEHHYELAFHHGGELFEIRQQERAQLQQLGFDIPRMERGVEHLRDRFHHFTPAMVRYYSPGGMLGGLALLDLNEDALYWLRVRQEMTVRYFTALRDRINKLDRKAKLATIPRTATFSLLTTQDYQRTHQYFDYIFPKHYFWNRGFDGMYGTVARWVERISEWNPGLTERDCFAVVKSLFGLELPGIHSRADLELGFPEEFFSQVVASETRRALDAVGDDNKVIAWVSSGRHPHAGDPMPSADLYRILVASQKAGLKRFIYHPDPDLGAAEWEVISGLCGKRWKEDPTGYWPSDTAKPDTWSGERKPGDSK